MKPRYYYPAKPFVINQRWGIRNPAYEQFGFSAHNGTDFRLGSDKRVRYPWEGTGTVVRIGFQPKGGGIFVGVMSNEVYQFPDGRAARILSDFLHCEEIIAKEGDQVATGDVLAIADNTGFSTGPHTHEQDRRVSTWNGKTGEALQFAMADRNDANNSFDPLDYATGMYAEGYSTVRNLLVLIVARLQSLLSKR